MNVDGIAANAAAIDSLSAVNDSLHMVNAAGIEDNAEAISALTAENNILKAANTTLKSRIDSLQVANETLKADVAVLRVAMQQYVDSAIAAALQSVCGCDTNNGAETPAPTTVPEGYVDLGLPSGLLWATCNLGATSPEKYGNYNAWGETKTKSTYDWSTYQYANGGYSKLTKYCNSSSYGNNGFVDDLTTLLPEDDAATQVLGSGARVPTKEEWQELMDNTTVEWTTMNGVNGGLFSAANGKTLFLPATGYRDFRTLNDAGGNCSYWSASLRGDDLPSGAWYFYIYSGDKNMSSNGRSRGLSVRAVRAK